MTVPALSSANVGPMGPGKTTYSIPQEVKKSDGPRTVTEEHKALFKQFTDKALQSNNYANFDDKTLLNLLSASHMFSADPAYSSMVRQIILNKKGRDLSHEENTEIAKMFVDEQFRGNKLFDSELCSPFLQSKDFAEQYVSMVKERTIKWKNEQKQAKKP